MIVRHGDTIDGMDIVFFLLCERLYSSQYFQMNEHEGLALSILCHPDVEKKEMHTRSHDK